MIKITKLGTLPLPVIFFGKCRTCGTEYECDREDTGKAQWVLISAGASAQYGMPTIACPHCGESTTASGVKQ